MSWYEKIYGFVSFVVAIYILGDTPFGVKILAMILTVCGVTLMRDGE